MALITDPDLLSQGARTGVTDMVFGSPTGALVTITSAGSNLPAISPGSFFDLAALIFGAWLGIKLQRNFMSDHVVPTCDNDA